MRARIMGAYRTIAEHSPPRCVDEDRFGVRASGTRVLIRLNLTPSPGVWAWPPCLPISPAQAPYITSDRGDLGVALG